MRISRKLLILLLALGGSVAYGTVGVYLLRAQYAGINSWFDAFYYTMVTYATLGGNMSPSTEWARLFVCTMVVVGVGCFATVLSLIVAPYIEKKIRKVLVMLQNIGDFSSHTIVCGFNAITWQIMQTYQQQKKDVIIILKDDSKVSLMEAFNFNYIVGDSTLKEVLSLACVKTANQIICGIDDDAQNILLSMMITELKETYDNTKLQTVAIIQNPNNKERAMRSGADQVILPAQLTVEALQKIDA